MGDSTEFEIKRVFKLNAEDWERFQEALNAPPRDLPRLRKLMQEKSFVELSQENRLKDGDWRSRNRHPGASRDPDLPCED